MKHFTIGLMVLLLMAALFVIAQDDEGAIDAGKQPVKTETDDERYERMLRAFDNQGADKEKIVVSFGDQVTKEEAENILQSFGLELRRIEVCTSTVDPGQEPVDMGCEYFDDWSDSTTSATANVPAGTDLRELAEELYAHEKIIWVEPSFLAEVAGGDEGEYDDKTHPVLEDTSKGVEKASFFQRLWRWLVSLFS